MNELQNMCLVKYLGIEAYRGENMKKERMFGGRMDLKKDEIKTVTTEEKIERNKKTDW
jgi:hypothetical protein